ncbi:hypothetical protein MLD63_02115 (plasmid) [Paracoccus sp. TK19116]|uniref:NERD domain-containing protein n=1 Tax=Paracoccus albicereus TaxID=2922394 RepID=A0ABT1MLR4_9RHOB|nr:hypothetical protein [Paracoccus albicereus]MCQ0969232.1 hypothetical protein [Paracoccus albicereus]
MQTRFSDWCSRAKLFSGKSNPAKSLFEKNMRLNLLEKRKDMNEEDFFPLAHAFDAGESGDIDLVLRVGPIVLVCEIKTYLNANEPRRRHRILESLRDAGGQLESKLSWVRHNRAVLSQAIK